jgi:outer membrane murein-binding lipoprotein Lpp
MIVGLQNQLADARADADRLRSDADQLRSDADRLRSDVDRLRGRRDEDGDPAR